MFKILIGSALSIASISLLTLPAAAATNPDYGCYIQTGSRQIVDLTRSVCGFNAVQAAKDAKKDAAYLSAVRTLLRQDYGGNTSLTNLVKTNPELLTAAARDYCQARQNGKSDEEVMETTYRETMASPRMADSNPTTRQEAEQLQRQMEAKLVPTQLALSLASKHYCPNLNNQASQ